MFKPHKSTLRVIRKKDPNWYLSDGITKRPRAGFEINTSCPEEYKRIVLQCIEYGWLSPVATITEKEYIWEQLVA